MVPDDKMLIETDSPYLAPEPVRGTRNDSRNIKYTAQKIAELRGVQVEEIAKQCPAGQKPQDIAYSWSCLLCVEG